MSSDGVRCYVCNTLTAGEINSEASADGHSWAGAIVCEGCKENLQTRFLIRFALPERNVPRLILRRREAAT